MTTRRWLPWAVLAVVVGVALLVGTRAPGRQTAAQKASAIASEVKCPACDGQSAELSDAPAAKAVRQFILTQVEAGQSRAQIEQELQDRYTNILLVPPAGGVAGLVWVLPVVALVVAAAGLVVAFRRWAAMADAPVSEEDRALVARALADADGDGGR
jgi:cytochrome c-type biogenesis protein CcmH